MTYNPRKVTNEFTVDKPPFVFYLNQRADIIDHTVEVAVDGTDMTDQFRDMPTVMGEGNAIYTGAELGQGSTLLAAFVPRDYVLETMPPPPPPPPPDPGDDDGDPPPTGGGGGVFDPVPTDPPEPTDPADPGDSAEPVGPVDPAPEPEQPPADPAPEAEQPPVDPAPEPEQPPAEPEQPGADAGQASNSASPS